MSAQQFEIGFIGTGIMGKPMAKNLLKAGYAVNIFARNPEKVKDLIDGGAKIFPSIIELADKCNIIITMLTNSPDCMEVIIGDKGIINSSRKDLVIIDMSSIDPMVSKKISAELSKKGMEFLDAPVSGGERGAVEGSLAIMAGGKKEIFEKVLPIFKVLGKSYTLVGEVGAGNFTKLANQIISAINIAAICEAFILAKKAGLSLATVYDAIKHGLAGSKVLDYHGPAIIENNFKPGFKIKLHKKDLQNAENAASSLDVPLPLTSQLFEILKSLTSKGYGELDNSAIVKYFEEISEVKIRS